MRFSFRGYFAVAAVTAAVLLFAPMRAAAQGAPTATDDRQARAAASKAAVQAAINAALAKPTPRAKDGRPILTGAWANGPRLGTQWKINKDSKGSIQVFIAEGGPDVGTTAPRPDPNPPAYKPELLPKVKELAADATDKDPGFTCAPMGVPRLGAPIKIVESPGEVVLFYWHEQALNFRIIPTDGRPHRADVDPSADGDSVGHWEGDTLVIDVTEFNADTWLSGRGYFHSTQMHVIERLTRKGDTIRYEVTVEDPGVFTKPWAMASATLVLIPTEPIEQVFPCIERDQPHMVDKGPL